MDAGQLELRPKELPGTVDPHLHCADRGSGGLRHLFVGALLDMLEYERLPLFRGKGGQRRVHHLADRTPFHPERWTHVGRRLGEGDRHSFPGRRALQVIEAAIAKDPGKPHPESLWIPALGKPLICPNERVLDQVGSGVSVEPDGTGVAVESVLVSAHQQRKGFLTSGECLVNELSVGRFRLQGGLLVSGSIGSCLGLTHSDL